MRIFYFQAKKQIFAIRQKGDNTLKRLKQFKFVEWVIGFLVIKNSQTTRN